MFPACIRRQCFLSLESIDGVKGTGRKKRTMSDETRTVDGGTAEAAAEGTENTVTAALDTPGTEMSTGGSTEAMMTEEAGTMAGMTDMEGTDLSVTDISGAFAAPSDAEPAKPDGPKAGGPKGGKKRHKKKMKLTMPILAGMIAAALIVVVVLVLAVVSVFRSDAPQTEENPGMVAQAGGEERLSSLTGEPGAPAQREIKELKPAEDPTPTATPTPTPVPEPEEDEETEEGEGEGEEEEAEEEGDGDAGLTVAATNSGCRLQDAGTFVLTAKFDSVPASDDGQLYVYRLSPFQYSLDGAAQVGTTELSANPSAGISVGAIGQTRALTGKFVFAVKNGGAMQMLGEPQYITNPEVLATNTRARVAYPPKGLADIFYNYNMDTETGGNHLILQINNYGNNPAMRHPSSYGGDSHPVDEGPFQYMFNAATEDGVNALFNSMHNLAATHITQDFIIGNEVNERKWCYVTYMDWDSYVRNYMQVFRVAYNAIKSANANARCFICISQDWDRNRTPGEEEYYRYIDAKDFIAKFNSMICAGGNIDWCVACHPHLVPLTYAKFWDMGGIANGAYYNLMVQSNAMLTFLNLSTLTNYMQSAALLSPSGRVRGIIASETAIPASQGADVQGAALYASYQACIRNRYIETMIYSPDPTIGSVFSDKATEVYNNMGGPNDATYDAWAKSVIGISDWGQVLR